jgi:hypothetical protein
MVFSSVTSSGGHKARPYEAEDENETMGVDDPRALAAVRAFYRRWNRQ